MACAAICQPNREEEGAYLDSRVCSQFKQRPRNGMRCGLVPSGKEDACIGGHALQRKRSAILVVDTATETGPQGGVTLRLWPSLLDQLCQPVIVLQRIRARLGLGTARLHANLRSSLKVILSRVLLLTRHSAFALKSMRSESCVSNS